MTRYAIGVRLLPADCGRRMLLSVVATGAFLRIVTTIGLTQGRVRLVTRKAGKCSLTVLKAAALLQIRWLMPYVPDGVPVHGELIPGKAMTGSAEFVDLLGIQFPRIANRLPRLLPATHHRGTLMGLSGSVAHFTADAQFR